MSDIEVDYAYDIDASGNLVHGDQLYFAYSGSGVATFIDAVGTGHKVKVGEHNLAGVGVDGTVYLDDDPKEEEPEEAEDVEEVVGDSYDLPDEESKTEEAKTKKEELVEKVEGLHEPDDLPVEAEVEDKPVKPTKRASSPKSQMKKTP